MKLFARKTFQRALFVLACLVTLGFLVWQFENFRGRRAWRNYKAAALVKGQTLEQKDLIPPPVPDASNFAAITFFKPLFDFEPRTQNYKNATATEQSTKYFDSMPRGYESTNPPTFNNWVGGLVDLRLFVSGIKDGHGTNTQPASTEAIPADKAAEQTLAFLSRYDDALNQIEQAAKRPESRFPIAYEVVPSVNVLLPHLALLRNITRVLCVRAAARLELGQTDAAARDIALIWRLAESIRTEPIIISHLVRLATLQASFQPLADGISRRAWSDAQLEAFQRELLSKNLFPDLRVGLRGEAVFMGGTIDQLRRGMVKSDLSGTIDADVLTGWPDGWYYMEMVNYHRLMDAFEGSIPEKPLIDPLEVDRLINENTKFLGATQAKRVLKHSVMSSLLVPALDRIVYKTCFGQDGLYMAGLACALERHRLTNGSYPESLEPLQNLIGRQAPPDVIKGQTLIYRREGNDSYNLYSVGWDGNDDGGKFVVKSGASGKEPAEDWVWRPVAQR